MLLLLFSRCFSNPTILLYACRPDFSGNFLTYRRFLSLKMLFLVYRHNETLQREYKKLWWSPKNATQFEITEVFNWIFWNFYFPFVKLFVVFRDVWLKCFHLFRTNFFQSSLLLFFVFLSLCMFVPKEFFFFPLQTATGKNVRRFSFFFLENCFDFVVLISAPVVTGIFFHHNWHHQSSPFSRTAEWLVFVVSRIKKKFFYLKIILVTILKRKKKKV